MQLLYLLGFSLAAIGILTAFKIEIRLIEERIKQYLNTNKKRTIYNQINKKPPKISIAINQIQNILKDTNQEHKLIITVALSVLLLVVAVFLSTFINNIYLLPVVALFSALLPFIQLWLMYSDYQQIVTCELESALSLITMTYQTNESFVNSVQQNLIHIKPPIKKHFERFVWMYENANPSLEACLLHLKMQINNKTFGRWCTTVIKCVDNHMIKHSLVEIISRLTEEKLLLTELRTKIRQERNEFFTIAFVDLSVLPLLYLLNRDWFNVIVDTDLGRFVLAINLGITFFAIFKTIIICNVTSFEEEMYDKKGANNSV